MVHPFYNGSVGDQHRRDGSQTKKRTGNRVVCVNRFAWYRGLDKYFLGAKV
jgi:hypothetical protein